MIKKGNSSINVVFRNTIYTNKLFARNINLIEDPAGDTLEVDFSHYSKRKRGNLEDLDFQSLEKNKDQISHFSISDSTVKKAVSAANVKLVKVKISEETSVSVVVAGYESENSFLR